MIQDEIDEKIRIIKRWMDKECGGYSSIAVGVNIFARKELPCCPLLLEKLVNIREKAHASFIRVGDESLLKRNSLIHQAAMVLLNKAIKEVELNKGTWCV